jgi:hypothetical protein
MCGQNIIFALIANNALVINRLNRKDLKAMSWVLLGKCTVQGNFRMLYCHVSTIFSLPQCLQFLIKGKLGV